MTSPGFVQSTGISIQAWNPDIDTSVPLYNPRGTPVNDQISDWASSYTHQIDANIGYKSATLTFSDRQVNTDDWIANGLGRHIEVYNHALVKVWEGFVNSLSATTGALSTTRGPLIDITNRAYVTFSRILDATVSPPVIGSNNLTTIAEDTDSQDRYGIVERILTAGTCFLADAERYRDTYLAENAEPQTGQTLTVGRSQFPTVTLNCLGYGEWLKAYTYNDTNTGTRALDDKVQDVLAGDINGLFSTDYSNIDTNAYLTQRQETGNATGWDIIQAVLALGDASDNRWLFSILNDRIAYYNQVPDDIAYQFSLSDPAQQVQTYGSGARVYPWDVRPGRWVFFTDYLIGRTQQTSDFRLDPRNQFIESVKYTAPFGIDLMGLKVGTLNQILAKMGLGGTAS